MSVEWSYGATFCAALGRVSSLHYAGPDGAVGAQRHR